MRIGILNGPNLNLLGSREPEIYGETNLEDIESMVRARARELNVTIDWFQSNHEGDLVDRLQEWGAGVDGAIVNAGAYTHTSIAIRDALLGVRLPFVEVHLSNIFGREEERAKSHTADIALGIVAGFGADVYVLGLEGLVAHLGSRDG